MKTGELELKEIEEVYIRKTNKLISFKYSDGSELRSTEDHPFWEAHKEDWVVASKLKLGDKVLDSENNIIEIKEIKEEIFEKEIDVYNLRVQDNHNYFANGVSQDACREMGCQASFPSASFFGKLVHNADPAEYNEKSITLKVEISRVINSKQTEERSNYYKEMQHTLNDLIKLTRSDKTFSATKRNNTLRDLNKLKERAETMAMNERAFDKILPSELSKIRENNNYQLTSFLNGDLNRMVSTKTEDFTKKGSDLARSIQSGLKTNLALALFENKGNVVDAGKLATKHFNLPSFITDKTQHSFLSSPNFSNNTNLDSWFLEQVNVIANSKQFKYIQQEYPHAESWEAFRIMITNKAVWDLKEYISPNKISKAQNSYVLGNTQVQYDVPGNIIYGYIGRRAGFTEKSLLVAAGYGQAGRLDTRNILSANWTGIGDKNSYYDDPIDQIWIRAGSELYSKCGDHCSTNDLNQTIQKYSKEIQQVKQPWKGDTLDERLSK